MADDGTLYITVSGHGYEINLRDLTPRDARDFRRVTGTPLVAAMSSPDVDHVAAFVWLHRRRSERKLTFAEVESDFTLGAIEYVGEDAPDEDDEGQVPEASGGS